MKNAVKTLVDIVEKEINNLIDKEYIYLNETETDFEYGKIYFEMSAKNKQEVGSEEDEILNHRYVRLEFKDVEITNENGKVLTNLSNEVFNQLEEVYTNY